MLPAIKEKITKLIDEATLLSNLKNPPTHDYPSLVASVMQLDLREEVLALKKMLSAADFAEQFRQRCLWRSHNPDATVVFSDFPESATNQLYWNIALLIFDPQTMGDMLEIVLPQVTICLEITLPNLQEPFSLRKHSEGTYPILRETPIATLKQAPDFKLLAHYVIEGSRIFNVNDISHFTLKIHNWFRDYLSGTCLPLAEKVYKHNAKLESLMTHIHLYINLGVTPLHAIKQLSQRLILGGSRFSGSQFASLSALEALKIFFTYFNALPQETQKGIRALRVAPNGKSIEEIIDIDIEQGKCVETSADLLNKAIEFNKNNPILTTTPHIAPEDLKKLEAQYGYKSPLDTERSEPRTLKLPSDLLKQALQNLVFKNYEELFFLLINFPSQCYELLCEHLDTETCQLRHIALLINGGFFSPEQRLALGKAVIKHYSRFKEKQPVLVWSISTNDALLVEEALATYESKHEAISASYQNYSVLHYVKNNERIFKVLLAPILKTERLGLLKTWGAQGDNVLQRNAPFPDMLLLLLESLPPEEIIEAIRAQNADHRSLLHSLLPYPKSLRAVLNLLQAEQQLQLVTEDILLLHSLRIHIESFKIILNVYPESQRASIITGSRSDNITVLHRCIENPKRLEFALHLIPSLQQVDAIKQTNKNNDTVLQTAAILSAADSLKILLEAIPEEQRFDLLTIKNKQGYSVLHEVTKNVTCFKIVFDLLPVDRRHDALMLETCDEKTVLYHAINRRSKINLLFLKNVLQLLPAIDRLAALSNLNNSCSNLLEYLLQDMNRIKTLLTLLPDNQKLAFLTTTVQNKPLIQILREKKITISATDPGFQNSFIPDLLSMYGIIIHHAIAKPGTMNFFKSVKGANFLLLLLFTETDTKRCKEKILLYLNKNPSNPLTIKLLDVLIPNKNINKINELQKKWDCPSQHNIEKMQTARL